MIANSADVDVAGIFSRLTALLPPISSFMPDHTPPPLSDRDLAYRRFVFPGALATLGSLSAIFPVEPAYIGFFILMPLTLISAIAVIQAAVLTIMIGRQEPLLIVLLVATLAITGVMIADASDHPILGIEGKIIDILGGIYGVFTLGATASWFLVRRRALQRDE